MYRVAAPFPTAPGKTETDIKSIPEYLRGNLSQYKESRKRLGITMERVYLQPTPMGSIIISYLETEHSFGEAVQSLVSSDLEVDRRFLEMVAEIHGVDFRQPPSGEPPETIGEWADSQVTGRRRGLAFIAPALPGKKEAGTAFCREAFVEREGEFAESRRALGENVEVVTFNSNPMGDFVCVYLEGNDPVEANGRFAASTRPFDVWFKDRLKELFPPEVDFSRPVPPVEQIWDYSTEQVAT